MKTYFFVVVGVNARFDDSTVSVLLAVSEDAAKVASREGNTLASLNVSSDAFNRGLCPGATGSLQGDLQESATKRADGTSFIRIRATKVALTRLGNRVVSADDVTWPK